MHIICLTPLEEGVYNDLKSKNIMAPPAGWAYIPDDFPLPLTFPRLGSIEAEEVTYTREVEVEREVIKMRDSGKVDDDLTPIMEEYTELEVVTEQREYTMMTVVSMTEGTPPVSAVDEPTQLDRIEAQVAYTAMCTDTLLEV